MVSAIKLSQSDASVLENYHARESYKIILKTELLEKLNSSEQKVFRKRFIECILATDMAYHSKNMNSLAMKMDMLEIHDGLNLDKLIDKDNSKLSETQQLILNVCVHSSDISNPAKPYVVYKKWVSFVFEEFFNQGDLEKNKGIPITIMCDRETTSITKSQIGFISFVVRPTFEILKKLNPAISPYCENITLNLKLYEEQNNKENSMKKANPSQLSS